MRAATTTEVVGSRAKRSIRLEKVESVIKMPRGGMSDFKHLLFLREIEKTCVEMKKDG